jgi:multidrug resistance efflux pump
MDDISSEVQSAGVKGFARRHKLPGLHIPGLHEPGLGMPGLNIKEMISSRTTRLGALALLLLLVLMFAYQTLFVLHSTQATLMPRVIVMRTPIDGIITITEQEIGVLVDPDTAFATVENKRANAGRLRVLRTAKSEAEARLTAIERRLRTLDEDLAKAGDTAKTFRGSRMAQIDASIREEQGNLAAARAVQRQARAALERARALEVGGDISHAAADNARRDSIVADSAVSSAEARLRSLAAEADAAISGVYGRETATDRSNSQQWQDHLKFSRGELLVELEGARTSAKALASELQGEEQHLRNLTLAPLVPPVQGRLMELLARSGEHVVAGQEIARLQDCRETHVLVDVDEATFRAIFIGMPARFKTTNEQNRQLGWVVQKFPPLDAQPGSTTPRYRVDMRLPHPEGECPAVTSGRVEFG